MLDVDTSMFKRSIRDLHIWFRFGFTSDVPPDKTLYYYLDMAPAHECTVSCRLLVAFILRYTYLLFYIYFNNSKIFNHIFGRIHGKSCLIEQPADAHFILADNSLKQVLPNTPKNIYSWA